MKVFTSNVPWQYNPADIMDFNSESKKSVKKKTKVSVVYPIFSELANSTDDPYWRERLLDSSINKFPKGIQFKNNTLTCKVKNKNCTQKLNFEDLDECRTQYIFFMHEFMNDYSPLELESSKKEIENMSNDTINICSWNKLLKEKNKIYAVKTYVENNYPELSCDEKIKLEDTIYLGLMCGVFSNQTIKVDNGKIVLINGLYRNENGNFTFDAQCQKKYKKNKLSKNDTTALTLNTVGSLMDDYAVEGAPLLKKWNSFISARNKKK